MSLKMQRRLAAELLGCGENRVKFDQERLDDIEGAITRADIRQLINDGAIYKEQERGQTRLRIKEKRGPGSRKGSRHSRLSRKERWIIRVRAQRRYLAGLRDGGKISRKSYRYVYLQVKAGRFKSVADLKRFLIENKLVKSRII